MNVSENQEYWLPIKGFDGYHISTYGRVFGPRGIMSPNLSKSKSHPYLRTRIGGSAQISKMKFVHRLMTETFISPPPSDKHQAAHNDGNRLNNNIWNLRWALPLENAEDRKRHMTVPRGDNHKSSKINSDIATRIRLLFNEHLDERRREGFRRVRRGFIKSSSKEIGVTEDTFRDVAYGRTWCGSATFSFEMMTPQWQIDCLNENLARATNKMPAKKKSVVAMESGGISIGIISIDDLKSDLDYDHITGEFRWSVSRGGRGEEIWLA